MNTEVESERQNIKYLAYPEFPDLSKYANKPGTLELVSLKYKANTSIITLKNFLISEKAHNQPNIYGNSKDIKHTLNSLYDIRKVIRETIKNLKKVEDNNV